jgi:hypothetical protein
MYLATLVGIDFGSENTMKYTKEGILTLYFLGLGRPEVTPVKQTLVKKLSHPATKQESQLQRLRSPLCLAFSTRGLVWKRM